MLTYYIVLTYIFSLGIIAGEDYASDQKPKPDPKAPQESSEEPVHWLVKLWFFILAPVSIPFYLGFFIANK